MLAVVLALLVLLAAAALGVAVPSLFWLTLVALGGVLLIGAVGVGVLATRDDDADEVRAAVVPLRLAGPAPLPRRRGTAQGGGEVRRAA